MDCGAVWFGLRQDVLTGLKRGGLGVVYGVYGVVLNPMPFSETIRATRVAGGTSERCDQSDWEASVSMVSHRL